MNGLRAAIVGGGLCGNLLAIALARAGMVVEVYEKRSLQQFRSPAGGRSINLALAARGISALRRFDAFSAIEPLLLPMRGRMIHEPGEQPQLVPYGAAGECIYSVSRAALNLELAELARTRHGVRFRFDCECVGVDSHSATPLIRRDGTVRALEADVIFAADGAGSVVRRSLAEAGALHSTESLLDHGYKELSVPPGSDPGADENADSATSPDAAGFRLDAGALHIWPRGDFMLIALPNTDGSFTATLFLARSGEPGFDELPAADIERFFAAQFPDAVGLIPDLAQQYAHNDVGILGTVRCDRWHADRCLLIGDAAHAIVPFHGQGMNAAFEDVAELDALLSGTPNAHRNWPELFAAFEQQRIENTNAIADMAIENYLEMRSDVRDPKFLLRRELALELERRYPGRFASRYAMVMFRADVPYAQARAIGAAQDAMLRSLTKGIQRTADVDFGAAERLVAELPRLGQARSR